MNGIISVLKPPGMTSHDVVAYLRKLLNIKRIGHTGTLDPGAAGVLPVCIGKATRLTEFITEKIKVYRCEMVLGVETDTLDSYGRIVSTSKDYPPLQAIHRVFDEFRGELLQTPPEYSAIKYKGKKLYEYAREGRDLDIPPRSIFVYRNQIIKYTAPNRILFEVECSKGTYVRALCRDMGRKMGCGAYMGFLLRCKSGKFSLEDSYTLDELIRCYDIGEIDKIILPMEHAVDELPKADLSPVHYKKLINGNLVYTDKEALDDSKAIGLEAGETTVRVYCGGRFIGIAAVEATKKGLCIKMKKVLV
ncbi:MAG: tRNA pseudouridine(55) synthase TruB [Clostridiales bacterium]|nr:tRNA pseudouridine(55) synthase TruB [Clostridiales bacterium]